MSVHRCVLQTYRDVRRISSSGASNSFIIFRQWMAICMIIILCFQSILCSEVKTIDSLQSLESLSQLALLRHHPQSVQEPPDNVNKSFTTLVQDLQNQNLTGEVTDFNCSLDFAHLPDVFCEGGALPKCMSVDEMLQLVPESTKSVSEALARLCPLLLLQMHSDVCTGPAVALDKVKLRPSSTAVWGYGLLFVTLISCCSLVGVIILPLLSKSAYHTVLMLFEGLAVGSLAGSSLFHLIPQTFQLIGQDVEHGYLWKSLIIFGGIYLFYLSERLMKIIITVKESRKKKISFDPENSTEPLKSLHESISQNGSISTPLKVDEYEKENFGDERSQILSSEKPNMQSSMILANGNANSSISATKYKVHKPEPLSHSHHHDHAVHLEKGQSTVSTVAWMIIFGDGLHNFIDGLSIGAAFSESILAGVSISVAVVCEEFPHELGDFAVLLSAGMTMRQALLYNFLSAITCYGGLVFGILLGDLAEASPYVFALAAGMFLYISLVDMMGELAEGIAEAKQKGTASQLKVLFIQNVGIILGVAILFIMARYAENFNFGSFNAFESVENTVDDHVKALYSGLQEAKHLHSSV